MMPAARHLPLIALICLSACAGQDDGYPSLLPTERILAEPALPDHAGPATASPAAIDAEAEARAAALRRRAEALRGPVIEPDIRARMRPGD